MATVVSVMTGAVDPPTSIGDSEPSGDEVTDSDTTDRVAERIALGNALDARTDDIVEWCQREFAKAFGSHAR